MSSLTYNTKLIFSNPVEKQKLMKVLEDQRFVVNECFKIAFDIRKSLNIVTLHSNFYKNFREKHPEIPSQIVIRGESEVLSTFKTIKSNKHKIEKTPVKTGLSSRLDKRLYTLISRNSMKLTTSNGRITVSFSEYEKLTELLNKYKFCDPLIFTKGKEIFIALTFQIPETVPSSNLALGVDLGIRINAATSEGNLYVDKKFNSDKRKLRFNKRKLQTAKSRRSRSALVDLAAELDDLPLMDPAEFTALFLSASRDGRLDFPELLRYSDRKRLGERFLNLINSVTSQNGDS